MKITDWTGDLFGVFTTNFSRKFLFFRKYDTYLRIYDTIMILRLHLKYIVSGSVLIPHLYSHFYSRSIDKGNDSQKQNTNETIRPVFITFYQSRFLSKVAILRIFF